MRTIKFSEARKDLSSLVDSAETVVIAKNSQPVAVLMDYDHYMSMLADLELLANPDREAILESHARVQRGDLAGFHEIELQTEDVGSS